MQPALRMAAVQSPIIPVVAELIRAHPGTISLGQGVVSYGPPPTAANRLTAFFADPENNKYKAVHGLPALLTALERKLETENDTPPDPAARLVVTAGGNMAFMNAVLAIADPGDEFILQSPYYFNHEMAIRMASARPVPVETDSAYHPQLDRVRSAITSRTRAVVTISPNNPSGAVYPEAELRAINALCRERGIYHIHDEAYEYFVYDGARHFSPGAIPGSAGHTISLYSLSKSYGFASWRIGYMRIPEWLFDPIRKIQDTILICPPVISQYAALGALEAGRDYCLERLKEIAAARTLVLDALGGIGDLCTVPPADGAFYALPRIHTRTNAMTLVERLIREHGVAVIPGTTFGVEDVCCLRVAFGALRKETAAEGIGRLVRGLRTIVKH